MLTRVVLTVARPGRRSAFALLLAVSAGVWGGCNSSSEPFTLAPAMLVGTWRYADAQGDTMAVTMSATDTVLAGSGWATNAQLRSMSGGMITEVPLTVSGWCSPSQRTVHLVGTSPSVPLLGAQLDATVQDVSHMLATWTITVNGAAYWTQTTAVTIPKS